MYRYTRAEDFEGAARFALFSGQLEKAMQYLRSCSKERLRMITPVLAAYVRVIPSLLSVATSLNTSSV